MLYFLRVALQHPETRIRIAAPGEVGVELAGHDVGTDDPLHRVEHVAGIHRFEIVAVKVVEREFFEVFFEVLGDYKAFRVERRLAERRFPLAAHYLKAEVHIEDKRNTAKPCALKIERSGLLALKKALHLSVELKAVGKPQSEWQPAVEQNLRRAGSGFEQKAGIISVLAKRKLLIAAEIGVGVLLAQHKPRCLGTGKGENALAKAAVFDFHARKAVAGMAEVLLAYSDKNVAQHILTQGGYKNIAKSKYVNDKQITDHYAIIPTGQGLGNLSALDGVKKGVYDLIVRRFLSIFLPPAEYQKVAVKMDRNGEKFFASAKILSKPGYLAVADRRFGQKNDTEKNGSENDNTADETKNNDKDGDSGQVANSEEFIEMVKSLKKGSILSCNGFNIKEGETSAPKRYTSGTLILAMENAGQLIEDEELRAQIKGSGIGTSATRDSIITKLINNKYIALNKKTQVVTPTFLGEIINDVVLYSVNGLLRADLTASWEKGLDMVASGTITEEEYSSKMCDYVRKYTNFVKSINNQNNMRFIFDKVAVYYTKEKKAKSKKA